MTGEELASLEQARDSLEQGREKALSIQCVNNLKQIGLAARIWASDNQDTYPPDFLSMSKQLYSPKILVCPADTNRAIAATFAIYTDANCSYEFLARSGSGLGPTHVLTRCPVHGHVGLCDGSAQSAAWKEHPDWFVQRGNRLYFEPPNTQSEPAKATKP